MNIAKRIEELRSLMKEKNMDAYIVPTADFHQSEYVGEHFKARKFITGFSGSAGTAVITTTEAKLWTDGRYFIQAAKQIEGTGVELMKMGEPGVPSIEEYLEAKLPEKTVLGFDGRVVAMGEGQGYEAIVSAKNGSILYDYDLIDSIWKDRPVLSEEPAFELGVEYAGETVASKLNRIRQYMKECGATTHILTTLDDICWTLNIRGNDIEFFPLVLSYAVITMDKMVVYINEAKLSDEIKSNFAKDGIELRPYNDIYEDVKKIDKNEVLLIDPSKLNYALYNNLPEGAQKVEKINPEILFKAIKNETEIKNIRVAQIKDSVAHVRFMKWLKENIGKEKITEISASEKLDSFRAEMGNFIRPSFEPISSFGEHAAIVHYTSSPETDVEFHEGTFYLSDTGAGFIEGSTDITRTFALGEVPAIMKEHFTLVAISNMQLANAKFMYGSTGQVLDILARKPFWDRNLNFNHGTGHGIGYLLNIHEAPTGFRWQHRAHEAHPFEAGMIVTNEPGIYIEGSHGIRLENELLCQAGEKNEYGQFMYFEPITYIPMDLDALEPSMMSDEDKKLLNEYHKLVFEKVSPHLNDEEKEWLAKYTREI
ncbi:aminopeptidase P family N-terminal domain-containing protein [Asaccharospora irregularis]|uniref:Xaa-Pro aminopeptidase n=1 Tax=Asaccharospora irregularis DSM 2635 TaxID=1121321 RepID=A0A1M5KMQ1_9FIRM|nr:aminopeptidase P family N-terminal domain-containing protein [Asaccharospora irregularis]SHG54006.1 Xaa-Pro aminopeptidase [Asaccharospora irregularis DSM 2635]